MANTKTWPDPDSQIGNQGRKDVMGVYMIDPTTQKATAPSGGGAITNDGTFAKETGGNLAQVVTNTTGLATQTTLAAAKSDLDTIVTQTSGLATAANQTTGNTNTANVATGIGGVADSAANNSTSSWSMIALLKGLYALLVSVLLVSRKAVAVFTQASTTTSGTTQNSGDLAVGAYTEISIDINTTAQAGTSPTIQYFYERKGADGIYYVLWQSAILTAAANTVSTSIGAGMAYPQSLGNTGRLRWVIGGSATPTFTHTLNIYGK